MSNDIFSSLIKIFCTGGLVLLSPVRGTLQTMVLKLDGNPEPYI